MKTSKFTYVSHLGTEYKNCNFIVNKYGTGNIALLIWNKVDGIITRCTINGRRVNGPYEIGVKDYSENKGMVKFLQGLGIIENTPIDIEESGWVSIPYYKLTEKGKKLVDSYEG